MAHVLDIMSRQRALNFPAGTQWSYSNSNYNLAAIVVERVSGQSFPAFTRERIFTPLGMTRSSWRDDYLRVVKGRATAYEPVKDGGFRTDMHYENVYGNCCLLTTVGDLPLWNENHGGATAGYRSSLIRLTDDDLSIAVLCNRGDANAGSLAHKVADVFLPAAPEPARAAAAVTDIDRFAGLYRDPLTDALLPITPARCVRVSQAAPSAAALEEHAGQYSSDEVGNTYRLFVVAGKLTVHVQPGMDIPLIPTYADAFRDESSDLVHFTRDAQGRVDGFDIAADFSMSEGTGRVARLHVTKK